MGGEEGMGLRNVSCITNMGDEAQDDDGNGEGGTLSQMPEHQ